MTKKHFQAFANILKAHNVKAELITEFCHYFRQQNPNFDAERFCNAAATSQRKANHALKMSR